VEYLKIFGWMIGIPLVFGIVFIIIPLIMKDWLSKKFPTIGYHFYNYSKNYKRIFITSIIVIVLYWYLSQPGDGPICIARDNYGCLEWE
jgi:hypothetical protein